MTVKDLIEALEMFDDDMEVVIGMQQRYGTNFAMRIRNDIEERAVRSFYGKDYNAIVITESEQCGSVDYRNEDEDWD